MATDKTTSSPDGSTLNLPGSTPTEAPVKKTRKPRTPKVKPEAGTVAVPLEEKPLSASLVSAQSMVARMYGTQTGFTPHTHNVQIQPGRVVVQGSIDELPSGFQPVGKVVISIDREIGVDKGFEAIFADVFADEDLTGVANHVIAEWPMLSPAEYSNL